MVDLRPDQLATVRAILQTEVPGCQVWAFGSRAKWSAQDTSDLDLAIDAGERLPLTKLARLRQAFEDSYLPIKVDVVDIKRVSDEFRGVIESQHVVLQTPSERIPVSGDRDAEWRTMPLEECVETIIDYRGKTPRKVSHGIPLITAKVVKGGRIETPDEFIAPDEYDDWMRRGMPLAGDVLLTMEAPLGEVAQLDNRKVALAQRLVALRGKAGLLDNTFLRYALQSEPVKEQLRSRATGTTVLGIRQSELRKINLPIPPLEVQRFIARVLRTLDDKIELNRRMHATLEAIVRALFLGWFVDFDPVRAKLDERKPAGMDKATAALFPEHFENTPLGPIPHGWKVGSLGDIGTNSRRGIQPQAITPNTRYITLEHMPRRSIALGKWGDSADVASGKSSFKKGEILFGKLRPYFHKVGVAPFDGVCSTDILVLTPKRPEWFGFLLGHASSDELIQFTDLASTGTKMPRTNWKDISAFKVVIPPMPIAAAFTRIIQVMVDRIQANLLQSRTLTTLRDALLPKLLSGEVSVTAKSGASK